MKNKHYNLTPPGPTQSKNNAYLKFLGIYINYYKIMLTKCDNAT